MSVFIFHSPKDVNETVGIIKAVVGHIGGKVKRESDNVISAAWRTKKCLTFSPMKFTFYVGKDMIRAVTPASMGAAVFSSLASNGADQNTTDLVLMDRGLGGPYEKAWNEFILGLEKHYPDIDFGISSGKIVVTDVKILGDRHQQVFTSRSVRNPSIGKALIGGALFGTPGAIVGGMSGTTYTQGKSADKLPSQVFATFRHSNGLVFDAVISKNSPTYHQIMVNMSELSNPTL